MALSYSISLMTDCPSDPLITLYTRMLIIKQSLIILRPLTFDDYPRLGSGYYDDEKFGVKLLR